MLIEQIINTYYKNNAKKLRMMVDKILKKLGFHNIDVDDFYCLANEIFFDVIKRYDGKRSFDGFLYSCLINKFKTEMTRRNRMKRQADKNSVSLDSPIGDDENSTIENTVAGKDTIESQFFGENREAYSKEMTEYLSRLSVLQKDVLHLISIGFTTNEIIGELHITKKQYDDCYNAIHSYRNIEVLL